MHQRLDLMNTYPNMSEDLSATHMYADFLGAYPNQQQAKTVSSSSSVSSASSACSSSSFKSTNEHSPFHQVQSHPPAASDQPPSFNLYSYVRGIYPQHPSASSSSSSSSSSASSSLSSPAHHLTANFSISTLMQHASPNTNHTQETKKLMHSKDEFLADKADGRVNHLNSLAIGQQQFSPNTASFITPSFTSNSSK